MPESFLRRSVTGPLRRREPAVLVAWAAIGLGTVIRLHQFGQRRSLWTDEAALAVNVVQRDFGGLLQPLDGNQGAPVLFLFAQRVAVLVGGNNEYALRLVPLGAGLAVLVLTCLVARRLGSATFAAVATSLVAFSPSLVRYSTEVKQYSSDAVIAVGLVLVALLAAESERPRRYLVALAVAGAVALWASHPAVFILAGTGTVLAARAAWRRRWSDLVPLAAVAALWAVSAGALYQVSLRGLDQNEFLASYWQDGFLPRPVTPGSAIRWLVEVAVGVMENPVGLALPAFALVMLAVGLWTLGQHHRIGLGMLVAFAPFLMLAAALELYPIQDRLVLFVVPLVVLGVGALVDLPANAWRSAAIAALAVVASTGVIDVVRMTVDPPEFAASRPVFQHVGTNWAPGDEVWIHDVTVEPYRYYGPIVGVDADRRTRWSTDGPCSVDATGQVWVVFAYTLSSRPDDEALRLRQHLAQQAQVVSVFERNDASAVLLDFDAPDGNQVDPDPDLGCIVTAAEPPVARSGLATAPFGTGATS